MAGFIASIILAVYLLILTLVRWRRIALFWPLLVIAFSLAFWSAAKLFEEQLQLPFWMLEWVRLFGFFTTLALFMWKFARLHLWLNVGVCAVLGLWLAYQMYGPEELGSLINPGFAGLVLLLLLHLVELAGNQFSETYRKEIATLAGSIGFILVWDLFCMLLFMLDETRSPEVLDIARSIVTSLAISFAIVHLQGIEHSRFQLNESLPRYRPESGLNIFAIYCWIAVVGYILIGMVTKNAELALAFLLTAGVGFVLLAYKKRFFGQLKILYRKLFSAYKYDYRESWIRFNRALDEANVTGNYYQLSIKAIANIIDSPAGKLWSLRNGSFGYVDHWELPLSKDMSYQLPESLSRFIDETNWVIDVHEYQKNPDMYRGLELDLSDPLFDNHRIFIPLRRNDELIGIVGLAASFSKPILNWEDHDLLKAAGLQMASYLAMFEATTQIYEQQHFDAFNRLSAFVVHDIKNVTAQLELITHNAERYRDNPEFIDDTFETVTSATQRLNKMLNQLKRGRSTSDLKKVCDLEDVVANFRKTADRLNWTGSIPKVKVIAEKDALLNVIQHLHQNGLEASDKDSLVTHHVELKNNQVHWHIYDKGTGMDSDFMRKQLFKPFATTKGNAGIGIGVYQCRYLLQSFGGDLIIHSELNQGTHCIAILDSPNGEKEGHNGTE
ncbi:XrtA/PEP-CTERM system histidine kinase PrsK [Kangiella spongicola]|uniref:histidine kinase n=1 Tax=Kangiella spongicola TaxID=796379 RepID=A0A318D8D8_9GAMM|nr:XrtA/PEP-CTERM system histidine kinase PrsK [Kangiella spongicola]PXF64175.1 PEP-CTERM system histidine kinase PrsK [Kangiella spongicola]